MEKKPKIKTKQKTIKFEMPTELTFYPPLINNIFYYLKYWKNRCVNHLGKRINYENLAVGVIFQSYYQIVNLQRVVNSSAYANLLQKCILSNNSSWTIISIPWTPSVVFVVAWLKMSLTISQANHKIKEYVSIDVEML